MPEGALALAEFQTAGRGRLGRTWEAPAGAAILSLGPAQAAAGRPLPQLALVAGVAVADALEQLTGLAVQIKWPNDVMLRRQKVAGSSPRRAAARSSSGSGSTSTRRAISCPERAGSLRTTTGREWARDVVLDAVLAALGSRYESGVAGGLDAIYTASGRATSCAAGR